MSPSSLERTHMCGALRAEHIGQTVTVCGWVHRHREIGGVTFIGLRDREGLIQLQFSQDADADLLERANSLGREFVIAARGEVVDRGEEHRNPNMPTGAVEILVTELDVLNQAKTPPFEIEDNLEVNSELRLKYRYLDLRRPILQENFRMRHRLIKAARDHLDGRGFYEIETPLLTKPTPEGARDVLVPARLSPGHFFALPQSPQIFKQILMMSGFDKYFQFARCMRDEDKRGDRQPEHTQLDLEMSFVKPTDVQTMIEGVAKEIMKATLGLELPTPFPHLSHRDAMAKYGSDKPDTRFEMPLVDLSDDLASCGFAVFAGTIADGKVVKALRIPTGHQMVSKGQFKNLEKDAKGRGAKGLAFIRYTDEGLVSPIAKFLTEDELATIQKRMSAEEGDLVVFVADTTNLADQILSHLRLTFGDQLDLRDNSRFDYLWVDNFPQFEYDEESNQVIAAHHPFVMPENPDALLAFADELRHSDGKVTPKAVDLAESIVATQYDLVVNGVELGSGSIRIVDPEIQDAMFVCLGISEEQAKAQFGFLLEALAYGAPPMAGIGIGVDRWLMVLLGLESIQDVIVFPKTAGAKGLLDDSPALADPAALEELGIAVVEPKK
ncbi:MAG: aspartate--tRNA ligase [Planctomycetota bacterium]